jgi:hypothetical protein
MPASAVACMSVITTAVLVHTADRGAACGQAGAGQGADSAPGGIGRAAQPAQGIDGAWSAETQLPTCRICHWCLARPIAASTRWVKSTWLAIRCTPKSMRGALAAGQNRGADGFRHGGGRPGPCGAGRRQPRRAAALAPGTGGCPAPLSNACSLVCRGHDDVRHVGFTGSACSNDPVLQGPACNCGGTCLQQEKALIESRAKWLDEELGRKSELLASERRANSEQVPGCIVRVTHAT